MIRYRLSRTAIDDLDTILTYLAEQSGWERSMNAEKRLFDSFERLAQDPGMGHRRLDRTSSPVYFFACEPYLVVHRGDTNPLQIIAIVHSSRDSRRLLRERFGSSPQR